MTRILFEINGNKYYRESCYIYYDMYIEDKNKYTPLMEKHWKLNYEYDHKFDDKYTYYWNPHWCWVKDEYIELSDEEFCSCSETHIWNKKGKYTICKNCEKVICIIYN